MPSDAPPATPRTTHDTISAAVRIDLMTVTDVAALLKVSKSWVYEHTRSRGVSRCDQLPYIKIGKYVRFDPECIRTFLDRQTARR